MQFKHPEILYALFLLLIPIFIHLFQLRRFQKVDFTNVAFLRKVIIQTRKSSQIKKWLTLLMRMLALASIVIAFAQPFTSSKTDISKEKEVVLYIDNSFSMQAKGSQGALLERALQDLYDRSEGNRISWFTNDTERRNVSIEDFKNEILRVPYSPNNLTPSQVLLKANQLFSNKVDIQKQLLFISDFQQREVFPEIPDDLEVDVVHLKAVKVSNVSIDSVFVKSKNASSVLLQVNVSKQGEAPSEVPVSLFNKEELIAKTAVIFQDDLKGSVEFDIDTSDGFVGKLEITDTNIPYDNTLFFSINKPEKIKVLAINQADGTFMQRLFDEEQFHLSQYAFDRLEYSRLPEQNFIILNQLKEIPSSLATALQAFSEDGGSVLIIPSPQIDIDSYNNFLLQMKMGKLLKMNNQDKKITKIVFSHPLFSDVFEKEVTNFQYPKVESFYELTSGATPALLFEDNSPFLLQSGQTYLFTAAIDNENSNFLNSPLIVPTIYNMGLQSLPLSNLYYTIGKQNTIAIPLQLGPDEILSIRNGDERFIPMQQSKANYVELTTLEDPIVSGNYEVLRKDEQIQYISYNYSREEGMLHYANPNDWKGVNVHKNIKELFSYLSDASAIHGFWKWFAIFALVFLIFEMLILKFFK